MQALYNRQVYGESLALQIESKGATTVSIANRWLLGWPERVSALIEARLLLQKLAEQSELEMDVLAEETGLKHLSVTEVLQVHGVSLEAPALN